MTLHESALAGAFFGCEAELPGRRWLPAVTLSVPLTRIREKGGFPATSEATLALREARNALQIVGTGVEWPSTA